MSGYIGTQPVPQATQTRQTFTATSGQTIFATFGYTPNFVDIYLNGVHLLNGTDYTASNGSDIVLTSGAAAGDVLEMLAYSTFEVAVAATAAQGALADSAVQPADLATVATTGSYNDLSDTPTVFPSGTKMLFAQTVAPTGWTKDTTHNDKALRVVSGTAGSGGSVAFTTAFASQAVSGTVNSHTLSWDEMPVHSHAQYITATPNSGGTGVRQDYVKDSSGLSAYSQGINTGTAGSGWGHSHGFTGTAINLAVQYVDIIIATKD